MTRARSDPRYGTGRWQRVRLRVLARDLHVCRSEPGCTVPATVADHIIPAHPGMPDELFFGESNLRASCRGHNIARGMAAKDAPDAVAAPQASHPSAVVTGDFT